MMGDKGILEVLDWGTLGYQDAMARQGILVAQRLAGASPDRLVLVEHPAVVTVGRSGAETDLRVSAEVLRRAGVELSESSRGGRATCHAPGQVVAYPIVKIGDRDLHAYVASLLVTLAAVLRSFGLEPELREGTPGVWVGGNKVASLGIAVRKWVTSHGVALNVSNDLTTFQWIVPCGNPDEAITSMERELGRPVDLEEVRERFVWEFCRRFGYGQRWQTGHRAKEILEAEAALP